MMGEKEKGAGRVVGKNGKRGQTRGGIERTIGWTNKQGTSEKEFLSNVNRFVLDSTTKRFYVLN